MQIPQDFSRFIRLGAIPAAVCAAALALAEKSIADTYFRSDLGLADAAAGALAEDLNAPGVLQ